MNSESGEKRRKTLFKGLGDINLIEKGEDQHALGLVESGGSFFNSFKPQDGVTIMEGLAKVKKGNSFKSQAGNLSKMEYSKNYSQKPFELKGILSNSQSVGNLGQPKKSQNISFYEESTLPPIMSPRNRYRVENENDETQEFELEQSAIPVKKSDDVIVKAGDISELVTLDKNILDDINETNNGAKTERKQKYSILPQFISRKSRNESIIQTLAKTMNVNELTRSQILDPFKTVDPNEVIDNFNKDILSSANWGSDSGGIKQINKILRNRPKEFKPNLKYCPLSPKINKQMQLERHRNNSKLLRMPSEEKFITQFTE